RLTLHVVFGFCRRHAHITTRVEPDRGNRAGGFCRIRWATCLGHRTSDAHFHLKAPRGKERLARDDTTHAFAFAPQSSHRTVVGLAVRGAHQHVAVLALIALFLRHSHILRHHAVIPIAPVPPHHIPSRRINLATRPIFLHHQFRSLRKWR